MLIQRLELENVKSYRREAVEFKEGVNFVCGANGSGKSTLVEAIGYALFNVAPGKLETFLRDGATRGSVRLQFLADDEKVYLSERKFSIRANTGWTITDVETGIIMDLHGDADKLDFLRRQALRLGSDRALHDLFETVIGVQQGTFAAPFTLPPVPRKDMFDRILGIEGYRQAYQRTSDVVTAFNSTLSNLNVQRTQLMNDLVEYDSVRERIAALVTELEVLREKATRLEQMLLEVSRRLQGLEQQEREIRAAESASKDAQMRLAASQERVRNETARYTQATAAAQVCDRNADAYNAYEAAKSQESELLTRQKSQQTLVERRNRLERERATSEAKIQALRENIAAQETEFREDSDRLAAKSRELLPRLTELATKTQEADTARIRWQAAERQVESLQTVSMKLDELARYVSDTRRTIRTLDDQRAKALEKLKEIAEIQSLAESRADLESERNRVYEHVNTLKVRLEQAKKHRRSAKGGNCPILNDPCKNVGGNLETYFVREIELLEEEFGTPQSELAVADAALQRAIGATERLKDLERARSQADDLTGDIEQEREGIAARRDELAWKEWVELFESIRIDVSNASDESAAESRHRSLGRTFADLSKCRTDDPALFQTQVEEAASRLRTMREGWLQTVREEKQDAEKAYQAAFGELHEAKSVQGTLNDERTKLSQREKKRAEARSDLTRFETEFRALSESLAMVEEEMESYADVDGRLQNVRESLAANESGYREYLQNRNQAAERDTIAASLRTAQDFAEAAADAERTVAATYETLRKAWDESLLRVARSDRERLVADQAALGRDLVARKHELEDCRRRFAEMEERKRKVAALDADIQRTEDARSLAKFVRDRVLKQASERIGRAYLHRVSESATLLYRHLSRENVHLEWMPDYEIRLKGGADGTAKERIFRQLSGGEQMSAALAVRLALLQLLSRLGLAIFDEPTTNLDESRRQSLAAQLPELRRLCRQVIVISHDDAFDSIVDEVIRLEKTAESGSRLLER